MKLRISWIAIVLFLLAFTTPVVAQDDAPESETPPVVVVEESVPWWAVPVSVVVAVAVTAGLFTFYESRVQKTVREFGDNLQKSVPEFALKPIQDAAQNAQNAMMEVIYAVANSTPTQADNRQARELDRMTQTITDDVMGTYTVNANPQLLGEPLALQRGQAVPPGYTLASDNFIAVTHVQDGYEFAFDGNVDRAGFKQSISVTPGLYRATIEARAHEPVSLVAKVVMHTDEAPYETSAIPFDAGEQVYEWSNIRIQDTGDLRTEWLIDAGDGGKGEVTMLALRFEKVTSE